MNTKKNLLFIYFLFLCISNNVQAASSSNKLPDGNTLHHFIEQLPDDLLFHYIDTNRSILLTLTVHPAGREMIYQRNHCALRAGDLAYNRGFTPYLDILDNGIDETEQDIQAANLYFNAYSPSPVLGGNILHHFLGNLPENIYEHNIRKNIRFINRFIELGANPEQQDADGKTPFDIAIERNFTPYLYEGLFYYEEVSDNETDDRFYEEYEKYMEDNPLERNGNVLHCFLESLPQNPQDHDKDKVINALRRFIHYHDADLNEKNRENLTPYELAYQKRFPYLLILEPIQSSSSDNDERSSQELDYPYYDEDACDACYRYYEQLSPSEKNGNVLHFFLESLPNDHEKHDKESNIAMLTQFIDHYEADLNEKNHENLTPYDLTYQKRFLAYLPLLARNRSEDKNNDKLPSSSSPSHSPAPFDDDDDMPPLEPNSPLPKLTVPPVSTFFFSDFNQPEKYNLIEDDILPPSTQKASSSQFDRNDDDDLPPLIPNSQHNKDDDSSLAQVLGSQSEDSKPSSSSSPSQSPTPSARSKRDRTPSQNFSSDEASPSSPCSSITSHLASPSPVIQRVHERSPRKRKIQRTLNFSTKQHYADKCPKCADGTCPLGPKQQNNNEGNL
ncbi:hypothetical protein K2X40_05230 [Candidatus Babeliales bacterium]|nr:hypothetical protein [Candidatus Babeliales bacterium]